MPPPTASPDQSTSHYTRETGIGEAANRRIKAQAVGPDAPRFIQPKETVMFRMFTIAAALALTITAAQAGDTDSLSSRVHDAAVTACAPESASVAGPVGHYGAITEQCIYRISNAAMIKYRNEAEAKAARAKLANN